jgi:hypothetical protein
MHDHRLTTFLIAAGMATGMASAAVRASDMLAECVGLQDDTERLACYDRLSGRTAVAGSATATAAAAPSSAPEPVADFGLTARAVQERDYGNSVDSITGTVKGVSQNASGRYVVELDNGQLWAQSETDSYPVVRAGDMVTIKRGAVGSFVLSGPHSVSWRVRRVR